MSDLNDLLDMQLDDLEDLPSFKAFPPGAHRVFATLEAKEVAGKKAVELSITCIESVQVADGFEAPKEKDKASSLYFLDNEFGRGKFKEVARAFAGFANTTNLGEIVEAVTDVECVVITSHQKNTADPANPYMNVKEIEVL